VFALLELLFDVRFGVVAVVIVVAFSPGRRWPSRVEVAERSRLDLRGGKEGVEVRDPHLHDSADPVRGDLAGVDQLVEHPKVDPEIPGCLGGASQIGSLAAPVDMEQRVWLVLPIAGDHVVVGDTTPRVDVQRDADGTVIVVRLACCSLALAMQLRADQPS
jgi:hypothetical protein